jgi:amino acid adenylation domain-containing protein
VLYTSGSTGRPKGVQISHGALANLLRAMRERPGLGAADRLLAVTPVSFDISGLELYLPLSAGAELVLASRKTATDGARLLAALAESGATVLQATPATWRLLLAAGWNATPDLRAWCGGEALPPELAAEMVARAGEVWNLYGPTETTVWSAASRVEAGGAVTLGSPVAATSIHLVDRSLRPVPPGAAGELVIGGAGLARGYRGRSDWTAERFVPDPFEDRGSRLYRTGDLARRRASGELEFLGRLDHQVKVRGYRIELGEIEAVLARHPAVRQAVVVPREEARLVAFWTSEGLTEAPSFESFRSFLRERLPDYMIPAAFVHLEVLPLTPAGKVDRKALGRLELKGDLTSTFEAPRTALEETLAEIWRSVLRTGRVGRGDDFFDLGGHSLLATQVVSRLRVLLGVDMPLRALFEAPTLGSFAERVHRQMRREDGSSALSAVPPLTAAPELRGQPASLSFAQQRLWFLEQLERGTAAYNIPVALRLAGALDPAALEAAFTEVLRRHDALRTTFQAAGEEPLQTVAAPAPFDLPLVDLSALERGSEAEARRLLQQESRRPFDLAAGPLFRPVLIRLGPDEHALSATIHHIVSDGWSAGVMIRELVALYAAAREGRPSLLPELPLQYADFARWQRRWLATEEALSIELAFWREQLRDLPPRLDLPLDRARGAIQSPRGVRLPAGVGEVTAHALRALARAEGATLYMVLLAAFQALLGRLSGQTDLAVGAPVAGRTRVELEGLIGFFVNTLVIRGDLSGDPDLRTLIARARERTLAAQAHQDLPFERLVEDLQPERSLGATPLFQVMFVFQNTPSGDLTLPGLQAEMLPVDTGTAKFDLLLSLEETDPSGPLTGWLELNTDLFDTTTVRRLLGHFETLLEGAVASPGMRLSDLPLLPAWERHQVLLEGNDPAEVPVPWGTIHEAFERQAARTPDALALIAGTERLSYAELDRRANRLARHLARYLDDGTAGPEQIVGVCLPRNADLPVTLLAILKAGAAYLPLDPAYPAERIAFMLDDSRAAVVVTLAGLLPRSGAGEVEWAEIDLDREREALAALPSAPRESRESGRLAYLIYTSGSTGRPKGVAIEHAGAVRLLAWAGTLHGADELSRVLAATSINFDLSVYELFLPLAFGGAVVLAEDALALPSLPAAGEVTLINTVPSAAAALLEMGPLPPAVRTVNLAGEPLRRALVDRLYASSGVERVWNLYGPSEDTTYSTFALAARGEVGEPTIGRPVADSQAYVTGPGLHLQPVGVPGELCLGGGGLARGYLDRPELTAERFIPDPFGGTLGARLYRTGDLVRRRTDGEIEFLGRIDHQVKIRGFRIELGEIETALARHPGVQEAAVLARDDGNGLRLVAYVAPRPASATGEPGTGVSAAEHVAAWGTIYDGVYQRSAHRADPLFDIDCWLSSYTGEPIPAEEMREWVDRTVERVRGRSPRRVLEVGCGTGLLLYRVAPHTERYRGTDLSEVALAGIRRQLAAQGQDLSRIDLVRAAADDWTGVAPGDFDLVVLNSVAQYFPGAAYLARFVADAVRAVGSEGAVFLGDLRSLPLLEAFHASVELHNGPGGLSAAELRERVLRRLEAEEELAVDPAFFQVLAGALPAIRRIRVLLKRGSFHNELTRYRYDVVLEVGGAAAPDPPADILDARREPLDLAVLESRLAAGPEALGLVEIPNARLAAAGAEAVDPEAVWALAERHGYEAEIGWGETPWTFRAVLRKPGAETAAPAGEPAGPVPSIEELMPLLATRTNDPLRSRASRQARTRLVPELRRALEAELPDYMVPAAFVLLDALPLTPNGKVDRLALARIVPTGEGVLSAPERSAPEGPVEELLAGIWSELLWADAIGRDDNFFELGGHSLLATRIVARVREALGVELPLTAIFEAPTLAGLARRIEAERHGPAAGPIVPVSRARPLPLSFAQRRLWFLDRLEPGQAAYNMPLEVRLSGRLDVPALACALEGVVRRHEILRAAFVLEGEEPAQIFALAAPLPLPMADLAGLPSERAAAEARALARQEARRPFDLARGPLLRSRLIRLGESEHRLLLTLHHIVADGWSLEVLFRDLAALYAGALLPELAIQFADYAAWEGTFLADERLAPQLAYWEHQLSGVPILEMPADRPRRAVQSLRGATRETILPPDLIRSVAALARRERATVFNVLLAAFQALLCRYSGQADLAVGSPVANRGRAELEPLIGLFVNTLVLRTRLDPALPFRDLLDRVRRTALEAFRHADLPFERLVEHLNPERSLSHNPIFQTTFALQQVRRGGVELPGLTLEPAGAGSGAVKFDLSLSILDWGEGHRWTATLEHALDLFEEATAARLLRHFEILLAGAVAALDMPVARLPLLDEAERRQILEDWSQGGPPAGKGLPVPERVAAWARRTPEAPAVVWEGGMLSYGELDRRAGELAGRLRALGAGPEAVVGVYSGRSPEMVVGMLAAWKAGAAYAPLDPAWPRERVAFAVADAGMPVLLAQGGLGEGMEVEGTRLVALAEAVAGHEGGRWRPLPRVSAGEGRGGGAEAGTTAPSPSLPRFAGEGGTAPLSPETAGAALAYVIYTSGSTGTPKGVAIPHDALANLIDWHVRAFGITAADRTTHTSGVAFDAAIIEIWPTLVSGAALCLVDEEARLSPPRMVRWLAENRITVGWVPTPLAELVLDEPWPDGPPLRLLITGGDRLHRRPPAGARFTLINEYGPTECSVVSTCSAVEPEGSREGLPSIGRPIDGVRARVLDREMQPVPAGVPGELFIGGAGLGQGYVRRPDLTAASFVPDPFEGEGSRLYRTGDLVRFRPDGRLEFLRRLDDQVKIKGFRIELGEIEAALAAHPEVREAVALARMDSRGETRLVAYAMATHRGAEPEPAELRAFLGTRLPEYMVPSLFLFLDALPLNPSGKVDRAALPAPDWQRADTSGDFAPPRTPVEEMLAAVWSELLGVRRIGIHDNFFELGGHSLKAGQLTLRVRDTFGVEIPVRTVFEAPTVAAMAVAIGRKLVEQADPELLAQVLSEMQGA